MSAGMWSLVAIACALAALSVGRARAVGLRRKLHEASDSPPVDSATGMVSAEVSALRIQLECDKASRLGVPVHVAVADVRGGDSEEADVAGAELAVELPPSTVGVRAGESRFILLSSVGDPTSGIAMNQSIWDLHRYVLPEGSKADPILALLETS